MKVDGFIVYAETMVYVGLVVVISVVISNNYWRNPRIILNIDFSLAFIKLEYSCLDWIFMYL